MLFGFISMAIVSFCFQFLHWVQIRVSVFPSSHPNLDQNCISMKAIKTPGKATSDALIRQGLSVESGHSCFWSYFRKSCSINSWCPLAGSIWPVKPRTVQETKNRRLNIPSLLQFASRDN